MNRHDHTAIFEQLVIRALQHYQEKSPNVFPISSRYFQGHIDKYCEELGEDRTLTWHSTSFKSLKEFFVYLAQKKYIKLSFDGKIAGLNSPSSLPTSFSFTAPVNTNPSDPSLIASTPALTTSTTTSTAPLIPTPSVRKLDSEEGLPPPKRMKVMDLTNDDEDYLLKIQADAFKAPKSPKKSIKKKKEVIILEKPPKQQNNAASCPICGTVLYNLDTSAINRHIDDCLTNDYLSNEIGAEDSNSSRDSEPLTFFCPYQTCSAPDIRMSAVQFVQHVAAMHVTEQNQNIFCPICNLFEEADYGGNSLHLWNHLSVIHADLLRQAAMPPPIRPHYQTVGGDSDEDDDDDGDGDEDDDVNVNLSMLEEVHPAVRITPVQVKEVPMYVKAPHKKTHHSHPPPIPVLPPPANIVNTTTTTQPPITTSTTRTTANSQYIVYDLKNTLPDKECSICFEDFRQGDSVARMECMCVYHKCCIERWFEQRKKCPFHGEDL